MSEEPSENAPAPADESGAKRKADGHVHLHVVQSGGAGEKKTPWDWARGLVIACGLGSVGLFGASYFQNWWKFWLYAPQYPKGLQLEISLRGMGGDVHEIDLLNHYIGMKHLADAAPTERQIGGYAVAGLCIVTMVALMIGGRKLNKFMAIPAVGFPVFFLADSLYWLYKFGHDLDPKAPLRIGAFTPQMFGNGVIGQFETFATPQLGFWMALGAVALALAGTFFRSRVCAHCGRGGECAAVCPRLMVLPNKPKESAS